MISPAGLLSGLSFGEPLEPCSTPLRMLVPFDPLSFVQRLLAYAAQVFQPTSDKGIYGPKNPTASKWGKSPMRLLVCMLLDRP